MVDKDITSSERHAQSTESVQALERALVAERHRNELLELRLMELVEGEGVANADARFEQISGNLTNVNRAFHQEMRTLLKRAIVVMCIVGGASALVGAAVAACILILLQS